MVTVMIRDVDTSRGQSDSTHHEAELLLSEFMVHHVLDTTHAATHGTRLRSLDSLLSVCWTFQHGLCILAHDELCADAVFSVQLRPGCSTPDD
eukprot:85749-Rhodomonas_salina.2